MDLLGDGMGAILFRVGLGICALLCVGMMGLLLVETVRRGGWGFFAVTVVAILGVACVMVGDALDQGRRS